MNKFQFEMLADLSNIELKELSEKCEKELEQRINHRKVELWSKIKQAIIDYHKEFDEIEIYKGDYEDNLYIDNECFDDIGRINLSAWY